MSLLWLLVIFYRCSISKHSRKQFTIPLPLFIDHLANNLYWTDSERSTIEVFDLNRHERTVVSTFLGDQTPIALALVPEKGYKIINIIRSNHALLLLFFFLQINQLYSKMFVALKSLVNTHIDAMDMNGHGLHFHAIEGDIGNGHVNMIVDWDLEEIFWSDSQLNKISFTDFDGNICAYEH